MEKKTFKEIDREYDLEIEKIVKTVKKEKAKTVLLQFPDGLKPYSTVIADELEKRLEEQKIKVEVLIWLGSCFGACDVPVQVERLKPKIDLIVQFGHSAWDYKKEKGIEVLK